MPSQTDTIPTQPGYDLSVQINVESKGGSYDVRCHGANGTLTFGPFSSLSMALDEISDWAKRQADWNREQGR